MSLFTATIGVVISYFLISLQILNIDNLIIAFIWFLISIVTYWGGKKLDHSWFKPLSLDFLLTWMFCTVGVVLGFVIWTLIDQGSVSISFNQMVTVFFSFLPYSIGPSATTSLGLREK